MLLDILKLTLPSGGGWRRTVEIEIEPLKYGNQSYALPAINATVDVCKMIEGYSFRLRLQTGIIGPCMRCLDAAVIPIQLDLWEIDLPSGEEELVSPYLKDGYLLDIDSWAKDAIALEMPHRILCSQNCQGLCADCGANLNERFQKNFHSIKCHPSSELGWQI